MARNNLLACIDFNKQPKLYINARDSKLGGVFSEEGKKIAFYFKRINPSSKKLYDSRKGTTKNWQNFEINLNRIIWSKIKRYNNNDNINANL